MFGNNPFNLRGRATQETVQENKYVIPEEIPANERTAFHGAAAAAAKAGKKSFNFGGKTHPVTMKKDTAKAITSQNETSHDDSEMDPEDKKEKLKKKNVVDILQSTLMKDDNENLPIVLIGAGHDVYPKIVRRRYRGPPTTHYRCLARVGRTSTDNHRTHRGDADTITESQAAVTHKKNRYDGLDERI